MLWSCTVTWPFIADSPTLTLTLYSFAYFINRFHVLEQFVASSWIGQHIMDCSNITKSNNEAHKLNGIALCILTLIHVWSILLPCVTHKWKAQVVPGSCDYPLSERTPPGFKDADAENQIMSLQVDDIFRMVEMSLLLWCIDAIKHSLDATLLASWYPSTSFCCRPLFCRHCQETLSSP